MLFAETRPFVISWEKRLILLSAHEENAKKDPKEVDNPHGYEVNKN
jgi:hypothetical protein